MELKDLYGLVLVLVLIGIILGVGVIVLDSFSTNSAVVGATAGTAINNTRDAITPIGSTWLPLIVTVAAVAIVLTLVIRSFMMKR